MKIGTMNGVDLLRNVTELLLGINTEDINYINYNLKELKKNVLEFESSFKKMLKEKEQSKTVAE